MVLPTDLTLGCATPAVEWTEALPLGNGQIGAMRFKGPLYERFAHSEATLWSGGPSNGDDPAAKAVLPDLREAPFAGRPSEAFDLAQLTQGPFTDFYLPLGEGERPDRPRLSVALNGRP